MSEATSVACDFRIDSVIERLQRVRRERRAGRGDVDDELGRARGGRAFGCAEALNNSIIRHALLGEEAAREIDILCRNPHPLAAARAIGRCDILEIRHGAHVDPGARRGDHHIGVTEAEGAQEFELGLDVRDLLAHQILAGDAEMGRARGELGDDLGAGDIGDLDPGKADQRPAIVARAASLHEFETGAGEKGGSGLLQPALGGNGQNERRFGRGRGVEGHQSVPLAGSRSIAIAAPTAGMSALAPRRFASPS